MCRVKLSNLPRVQEEMLDILGQVDPKVSEVAKTCLTRA